MPAAEGPQLPDIVSRRPSRDLHGDLHPARVDDREQQQVDRPMPDVLELLSFDETRDGPSDRPSLQDLEVRDLIDGHRPEAPTGQPLRVAVAQEHLLGPLLELGVEAGGLPIPGAVGLQVHVVEDLPDNSRADGLDEAIGDGLSGQVLAGPVGDMQPPGDWLQAGRFDDLGSLAGNLLDDRGGVHPQKSCQATCSSAATEAPDGGPVTLHPRGNRVDQSPAATGRCGHAGP